MMLFPSATPDGKLLWIFGDIYFGWKPTGQPVTYRTDLAREISEKNHCRQMVRQLRNLNKNKKFLIFMTPDRMIGGIFC